VSYGKSLPHPSFILLAFACCSPSYFSCQYILLEQITLLSTHIKHRRSTVLYYGRIVEFITSKYTLFFLQIQRISYFLFIIFHSFLFFALKVRSIENYKLYILPECPRITSLVAAFDVKAFNDTELFKSYLELANGNRIINFCRQTNRKRHG